MTRKLPDPSRGPEESGMTGHAAEGECVLVVDFAHEETSAPGIDLRRRDAGFPDVRWEELHLVYHPRPCLYCIEPRGERRDLFEDEPKQHEVEVAVDRFRAGRVVEW